jgi:hypothetical protein
VEVVAVSSDLTAEERELMKDPRVARGARLEAEFRRRLLGDNRDHAELVDVVEALIESHPGWSAREVVEAVHRIYSEPKRPWWRFSL